MSTALAGVIFGDEDYHFLGQGAQLAFRPGGGPAHEPQGRAGIGGEARAGRAVFTRPF